MKPFVRGLVALSAMSVALQPCAAAAAPAPVQVASVRYDLGQPIAVTSASRSMSLAASHQTAAEAEQNAPRKGSSTKTILIVGGVLLLVVVVAAAVAGAMPTAGPPEGAFD